MSTAASTDALVRTGLLEEQHRRRHYLLIGLFKANASDFWWSALYRLGQELAQLVQPLLLAEILRFLEDQTVPVARGIWSCVLLFCAACLKTLLENHYFITCVRAGIRARAACIHLVYAKSLRLTAGNVAESSTGQIVNLMQMDAQKFYDSSWGIHMAWAAVLQIVGCVVLLFMYLGPAMLAGLLTMILLVPVNGALVKRQHRGRTVASTKTDARVNTINEVLLAIRAVKLYAWETLFCARIEGRRQEELVFIRWLGVNKALISTIANVAPSVVTLATLFVFAGVQGYSLDAATIFTSIALFENLKDPLSRLPDRITSYVDLLVASQRIEKFLGRDEIASHCQDQRAESDIKQHDKSTNAIVVQGSFGWEASHTQRENHDNCKHRQRPSQERKDMAQDKTARKKLQTNKGYSQLNQEDDELTLETVRAASTDRYAPLLRNLDLHVRHGDLVMIIGTVGSGKSNLLSAVLGEMVPLDCASAPIVNGQVAYMGQTPWILNMTLRKNVVISGRHDPVDEERYQEALRVSGLLEDLKALPAGDRTEIGERGINISGGQKARVSLARLVYSEATICLLDDPTAALDSTMSSHVIETCICGALQRQRRTRLLVTNMIEPAILRRADLVVWMDGGEIRACGPFDELMAEAEQHQTNNDCNLHCGGDGSNHAFAELLATRRKCSEEQNSPDTAQGKTGSETNESITRHKVGAVSSGTGKLVRAEDRETGVVAQTVYYRLFKHAGLGWVAATACVFVVSTCAQIGRDWFLAYWTDDSDQTDPAASAAHLMAWFALLTLSFVLLTLLRAIMLVMVGYYCSISLHKQMANAVLFSPLSFFDVTPTGRVLNRFAKDTESVDVKVWECWRGFLDLLFPMIGSLLLVSAVTPTFAVVLPVLAWCALRVQEYYRKTSRELKRLASIARTPMYDWFSCTLDGLSTIRAYELTKAFQLENAVRSDEANKMQYMQKICDRWLGTRLEMLGNMLCFVAMLLGVMARGQTAGAYIGLALASSMRLARTVNYAVRQFTQLESEMTSVERVLHFSDLPKEPYCSPITEAKLKNADYHDDGMDCRNSTLWHPSDGRVEFRNVHMRYRSNLPLVLQDVSFTVPSGHKLGVVGRTGSGKSSLIQVLFRLVEPSAGEIYIGTPGINSASLGVGALRSALAICPQDPVIFSGTIQTNMDPFSMEKESQITAALTRVGLGDFSLDYSVSDGGQNFSGGQRQLLCLARTLLRKSKILVLDEATSSVSPEIDAQLQLLLQEEFRGVTKIVIAHRLSSVLDADGILVMGAGQVLEAGAPEALLADPNGHLSRLQAIAVI